ncbi:hypothetical protein FKM82_015396 [Ascaphus truei]
MASPSRHATFLPMSPGTYSITLFHMTSTHTPFHCNEPHASSVHIYTYVMLHVQFMPFARACWTFLCMPPEHVSLCMEMMHTEVEDFEDGTRPCPSFSSALPFQVMSYSPSS